MSDRFEHACYVVAAALIAFGGWLGLVKLGSMLL